MEDITPQALPTGDQINDRARYVCARTMMHRYRNTVLDMADMLGVVRAVDGRPRNQHEVIEEAKKRLDELMSLNARRMKAITTFPQPRKQ